jgi:hypothetical protein
MPTASLIAEINSQKASEGAAQFARAASHMRESAAEVSKKLLGLGADLAASGISAAKAADVLGTHATKTRLATAGVVALGVAITAVSVVMAVKGASAAIAASDAYLKLENQLRNVVDAGENVRPVLETLQGVADRSRGTIAGTVALYAEQSDALTEYGVKGQEAIRVTETIARVMQLGGKEVGALGGELSKLASTPEGMRILAETTGKTRAELRELASQGRITSETMIVALSNAKTQIDAKFAAMPATAEQAFARIGASLSRAFSDAARDNKLSETFAEIYNQANRLASSDLVRLFADSTASGVRTLGDVVLSFAGAIDTAATSTRTLYRILSEQLGNGNGQGPISSAVDYVSGQFGRLGGVISGLASGAVERLRAMNPELANTLGIVVQVHQELGKMLSQQNDITRMRGSLGVDANTRGVVMADLTKDVPFGPDKANQGLIDGLAKQIELQRVQGQLIAAQIDGNGAIENKLRDQLEIRARISDAAKRDAPELAATLEAEIRRTNEAQRMLERKRTLREIDNESLANDLIRAQISNDPTRERALENELAVRRGVSAELRAQSPDLARQLELNILQNQELGRRKQLQDQLNAAGTQWAETIFSGLQSGIREGQKFGDVLKGVGARLLDMIVQFTVMKPLAESIGKSVGGFLGGAGGSSADPVGVLGAIGGIFGGGGVTAFANGGVFDSPVAMAGAGGFRGVMAENGPEAIMPLRRGPDGRLGIASTGGASGSVQNISISIQGDATNETVERLRQVVRNELAGAAPGLVNSSVQAVRAANLRDPSYLRR